ncbi:MAG TPA: hypothetical protein VGK54_03665 [Chloroflexota bacterium]
MTFDWVEFLRVAEDLYGAAATEASARREALLRIAVSRAYYAAFSLARNRLRDIDGVKVPLRGNAHLVVAHRFEEGVGIERQDIGARLQRLRVDRNRCDYDDEVDDLADIAAQSLRRAVAVVDALARL